MYHGEIRPPAECSANAAASAHVVSLRGALDASVAPMVGTALWGKAASARLFVVDLTRASLLSAATARVLSDLAGQLLGQARQVWFAAPEPLAGILSRVNRALTSLVVPTVSDVVVDGRFSHSHIDVRWLRNRAHIASAIEVLRLRHGIADEKAAFALLRTSSQRNNVTVRALAHELLSPHHGTAPPPTRPVLEFAPHAVTTSEVLAALLDTVLQVTNAGRGDVQTLDIPEDGLSLEHQRGFQETFADHLLHVQGNSAADSAWRTGQRVVVGDVATSPVLGAEDRRALLEAGVVALHSTPVVTPDGTCLGVVTDHHADRSALPHARGVLRAVDEVASAAGAWLDWHRRVVVPAAVAELHGLAGR
ncbi:ANTAR domain-containing protein [Actinosynnema sp. NPDC050436]|uniref:ANTAR domain-containing protein n=1 Tax=Actinosynnema sp. NPDC050436 TaxID=3155659 RepID=UPI0033C1F4F1